MNSIEMLKRFWQEEDGLEMVEWAMIGALIAAIILAAWGGIGTKVKNAMNRIGSGLDSAT
jgi:Flp pilus assembly pilin Flp